MATDVVLYYASFNSKSTGNTAYSVRYYTPAAYAAMCEMYDPGSTNVTRTVTKYTTKVSLQPSDAGTLYAHSSASYSYTNPVTKATVKTSRTGGTSITLNRYKYGSSFISVYGGNASYPDFPFLASIASGTVWFVAADEKHARFGGYIFEEGEYGAAASNIESGSEANASKIIYKNSDSIVYFGSGVSLDKSFVVFAGYYWYLALVANEIGGVTFNNSTRTVEDGKKRALVTDVEDFNSGSNASLTTKASDGTVTFIYNKRIISGLGDYLPNSNVRLVSPLTGTDGDGNYVSLRGLGTKADGSGTFYSVGSYIDEVLTRRLSLAAYDMRISLYGFWNVRVTVSIVANGGSGASVFYFGKGGNKFFADENLTAEITSIAPLTKADSVFLGLYETDSTDGAPVVSASGAIDGNFAPQTAATLYAQWRTVANITLQKKGGAGGDDALVYDSLIGGIIRPGGSEIVTRISPPARSGWLFLGYYSASSGGTQYIDANGDILAALSSLHPATGISIYAQWRFVSYVARLENGDAEDGATAFYNNGRDAVFYSSPTLEEGSDTDSLPIPVLTGHAFTGYWTAATGGTKTVDADGTILLAAPLSGDVVYYAQWAAKSYTLTFNYAGGDGPDESKQATWGEAVGTLPSPTTVPRQAVFVGWGLQGRIIDAGTIWNVDGDSTLVAVWDFGRGNVVDYFGMASAALIPFESNPGTAARRVATTVGGRYTGGSETGACTWRSPTVKYMVVQDMDLVADLGKAFAAEFTGTGKNKIMTVSGYMIVAVEVDTAAKAFPVVTVRSAANEGVDAINRFMAEVNVRARARAQNLMNAISGGGELQALKLSLHCDPVVLEEGLAPCASDVVRGEATVAAQTVALNHESAPVPGGGFELAGCPVQYSGIDYARYSLNARKGL